MENINKEHMPKNVKNFIAFDNVQIKRATVNVAKRLLISEHVVNQANCEKYKISLFKILQQFASLFYLCDLRLIITVFTVWVIIYAVLACFLSCKLIVRFIN